ncbi:MAG TPA: DUF433 domain-containing protein [Nitrolancea sp.]|nr:DUF433 domain-containing protein [Nitrolancea sp.]
MAQYQARKHDRIIRDPNILLGKPVVRGTRIPVALMLAKLVANPSLDDLFLDFPASPSRTSALASNTPATSSSS